MIKVKCLPTGSTPIDILLDGGLHQGEVTAIFGAAATGKTTISYQSIINAAKMGISTILFDTENKFDSRRVCQINNTIDLSECLLILQPESFDEQIRYLQILEVLSKDRPFKLLIIDTVTNLYRMEMSLQNTIFDVLNRSFEQHLARIHGETRRLELFTLVIGQVRDKENEKRPVGEDQLYTYAKNVLELKNVRFKGDDESIIEGLQVVLRKGIEDRVGRNLPYQITEKGICPI